MTPRDKENAGANSTRNSSQSESVDTSKSSLAASTLSTATAALPPPAGTPSRFLFTNQQPVVGQHHLVQRPNSTPTFFSTAQTPSPASTSKNMKQHQTQLTSPVATTPKHPSAAPFSAQKSPPGTSQVLRKHFQSLGFATPPGKHPPPHQHRLLSSGAVRTPNTNNASRSQKSHNASVASYNTRVGIDGTKYTPSKELLKSTTSSRNQRVLGLQDMSMEQQQHLELLEQHDDSNDVQMQHHQPMTTVVDEETSTVASAATTDDASFDFSLPSTTMNQHHHHHYSQQHPFQGISSSLSPSTPASLSPLTPRMGCLNPVAMTLLNDGREDYHYLLEQDSLYPIPKVEDSSTLPVEAREMPDGSSVLKQQPTNTSMESTSTSSSSSCLSPPHCFGVPGGNVQQSPAQVRGTLPHTVRSTLAYPVAMMPKTGRISPSNNNHSPRLVMRPQPHHVR